MVVGIEIEGVMEANGVGREPAHIVWVVEAVGEESETTDFSAVGKAPWRGETCVAKGDFVAEGGVTRPLGKDAVYGVESANVILLVLDRK